MARRSIRPTGGCSSSRRPCRSRASPARRRRLGEPSTGGVEAHELPVAHSELLDPATLERLGPLLRRAAGVTQRGIGTTSSPNTCAGPTAPGSRQPAPRKATPTPVHPFSLFSRPGERGDHGGSRASHQSRPSPHGARVTSQNQNHLSAGHRVGSGDERPEESTRRRRTVQPGRIDGGPGGPRASLARGRRRGPRPRVQTPALVVRVGSSVVDGGIVLPAIGGAPQQHLSGGGRRLQPDGVGADGGRRRSSHRHPTRSRSTGRPPDRPGPAPRSTRRAPARRPAPAQHGPESTRGPRAAPATTRPSLAGRLDHLTIRHGGDRRRSRPLRGTADGRPPPVLTSVS